ncbi:3054_t:CDS:2 [Dentiscutata heterogama]|uniref:3054_t:CDS:1 n=1 Tax=Dentiscutata heterogama TaxID=1316150 RepID=A0ACA9MNT4_9GLOM|nr:3054_t:CDS:2 [Dentiscutata heterogama]
MLPGSSAMSFSQFLNNEATDIDSGDKRANESSVNESSDDSNDSENDENLNQLTVNEFRWFYNDIENLIKENDSIFNKSKENRVNGNSHQRGGKMFKVQVASVARRKGTANKDQKKLQGKPRTSLQETTHDIKELNRYVMPARSRRQQTK